MTFGKSRYECSSIRPVVGLCVVTVILLSAPVLPSTAALARKRKAAHSLPRSRESVAEDCDPPALRTRHARHHPGFSPLPLVAAAWGHAPLLPLRGLAVRGGYALPELRADIPNIGNSV